MRAIINTPTTREHEIPYVCICISCRMGQKNETEIANPNAKSTPKLQTETKIRVGVAETWDRGVTERAPRRCRREFISAEGAKMKMAAPKARRGVGLGEHIDEYEMIH